MTRFPAMPRASLLAACVAAGLALPAHAQSQRASDDGRRGEPPARLGEILVLGTPADRQPGSPEELDERDVRPQRARTADTAGLLQDVPGVSLNSAGAISALPAIHGMAGQRNRIQVDGMDLVATCPNHMNPPLSYLDPAKVARIRLYAGISPVSAGGDSIGGTVLVESAPPEFAQDGQWIHGGNVSLGWRSNGDAASASASLHLANASWSLRYDGSAARAGNYRAGGDFRDFTASGVQDHAIPLDEVASSAYRVRNHLLGLAWRNDDHLLELTLGRQDMPLQGFPNQRMDLTGNTQDRFNLAWTGQFDWGTLKARAWEERVRHAMDFGPDKQFWYGAASAPPAGVIGHTIPCSPVGPACAAGMPMLTRGQTRAASIEASLRGDGDSVLRIGAELHRQRLDDWWPASGGMMWPGTFWNIHDGRRDRSALYAEWEGDVSPRWLLLAGARATRVVTDAGPVRGYDIDPAPPGSYMMTAADAARFNAADRLRRDLMVDASLLMRYRASDTLDLEFGLARKSRAPSLYERYAWSTWAMSAVMNNFTGDGNGYVGDPGLQPERAHTLAATLHWHAAGDDGAWLKLTPYVTHVERYIDAVALTANGPDSFNVLRHANHGARIHGLDASAQTPLGSGFSLRATASVLRGRNTVTDDDLWQQMPPNARLTLAHRRGAWEGALEWQLVAAKTRVSQVRNETPTAGYGLLHVRGSHAWKRLRLDAGIDNVLDRLHALPLGGAYLGQGASMGINSVPHGIVVPGPGRSAYLSATLSF